MPLNFSFIPHNSLRHPPRSPPPSNRLLRAARLAHSTENPGATVSEKISNKEHAKKTFPAGPGAGDRYMPLPDDSNSGHVRAHAIFTINADPQVLYDLWRRLDLIPTWQESVESVTELSATRSHWVLNTPGLGKNLEFDSEIIEDVPGEKIAWHSVPTTLTDEKEVEQLKNAGEVTFEFHPSGRGTIVTLIQTLKVPYGAAGKLAVSVFGRSPRQIVIENLRHFKQLAETGEIPRIDAEVHGPRGISGKAKQVAYGETNPVPPGTSEATSQAA